MAVELLRRSNDGRLTFVIDETGKTPPVKVLWSLLKAQSISAAISSLCVREEIPSHLSDSRIGTWSVGQKEPSRISNLDQWAIQKKMDAVIWTALTPRLKTGNDRPEVEEAINYLETLRGSVRAEAKRYIERAPGQVKTPYRDAIEFALDWHPQEH